MIEIALNNVSKSYGADLVLTNISFEMHTKDRIGLIGGNGTGKTTIFKIVAGIENADAGDVMIRKGVRVGYLQQIPVYPDEYPVHQVLRAAFSQLDELTYTLRQLEQQMSQLSGEQLAKTLKDYGRLQQEFEEQGGYEVDAQINKVCNGLQITDELRDRSFELLSGGEQTRVILGLMLLQQPDVLLLDEPSNHLDTQTLEWLEEYLRDYQGTVCVISHDRYFLDQIATRIIEVEDGECKAYFGNYSQYTKEKEQQLLEEFAQYQDQQKKIKAMEKAIKDMKDWGNRADNPKFHKRAASMQKRLDKMTRMDRPVLDRQKIHLEFAAGKRSGNDVYSVEDLTFGFGDQPILHKANLTLSYGERVAIVGSNGSGKSTLLKLLLEELEPQSGLIKRGSRVKIGYCQQQVLFANEEFSVLETFRDSYACTAGEARNMLAKFLFYGEDVFKKVEALSGGERSRLRLCQLMQEDINLLVLDEPTNHLDIDSIEMLEDALEGFRGTILFVSHDRYFINRIAKRVLDVVNYRFQEYLGDYDYYRTKKAIQTAQTKQNPALKLDKPQKKVSLSKENRSEQLEQRIIKLEQELLNHPKDSRLQQRLDNLLAAWVEL